MKMKPIKLGLLLASTLSLAAADAPRLEVRGASVTTNAAGQTTVIKGSAIVTLGDIKIFAEQIVHDRHTGVLRCVGEAKIETPRGVITGTDATIDLNSKQITLREARVRVGS